MTLSEALRSRVEAIPRDPERRAFLWATLIVNAALTRGDLWLASRRDPPELPFMSAGFVAIPSGVEPPAGVHHMDGYFFGLCLSPSASRFLSVTFLEPLRVAETSVPVLAMPAEFQRHQAPPGLVHPMSGSTAAGTSACWARPSAGVANPMRLGGDGILTAAHVAVHHVASTVTPSGVHAVAGFAIDAAVLEPVVIPAGVNLLPVATAVAPGTKVDVHLDPARHPGGALVTATILRTFQSAIYANVMVPQRIVIDAACTHGDSGALITLHGQREAVGLYVGDLVPIGGGPTRGVGQWMQQVVTELAIDLYL
ncbi:hypothetical protein KPL78_08720 [Roseomonas sp. HJA6]|uniref:Serine protease n=1 Tax=Roseomonas alba TaxID=2846776 RepID=A0ABS7A9C4_9PROT|nr:hypothetical protein [Neoroseomonas alba]MBW6397925.1 hypothetical protein [Neoroseomonas alba]